ncbi:MAG: hypothetical protein ACRDFB_00450, partial [Rhabdochlamydiaceae bacterium]
MIKKLGLLALFLIVFNGLEHFAHKKTDGFSLQRIQFEAPLTQGTTECFSELNQPFHYLDCGNQCYVFVSEDGRYVLKFFKYAQPSIPHFLTTIPILNHFKPFRPHRFEKLRWKQQRDFQGYRLAYDAFRQETALIAVHLDPIHHNYPLITLIDKLHSPHRLDLNHTPFVLQRKAAPVYQQLRQWIKSDQIDQAQKGITSLLNLLKKRMAHHLQDDDAHLHSNFGFIGHEAIQLDPGHFTQGPSANAELEMKIITAELLTWCE